VPPQLPLYHINDPPDPPVAVSVMFPVPDPQKLDGLLDADVGAVGAAQTTIALFIVYVGLDVLPQLWFTDARNVIE